MQKMSFLSQRRENIGTQAIHKDHWSFHLYVSQCHLLKLRGPAEHLIDGNEKRICRLSFEF